MSAAQRIWNSRGAGDTYAFKRTSSKLRSDGGIEQIEESLLVNEGSEEEAPVAEFRRTYSSLLADEAGVPIDIMKEALKEEGRDESAKPRVMSAAQRIWNSRGESTVYEMTRTSSSIQNDGSIEQIEESMSATEQGVDEALIPAFSRSYSILASPTPAFSRSYSSLLTDGGLEDIQESASVTEASENEAPIPAFSRSYSSLAAPTLAFSRSKSRLASPTPAFSRSYSSLLTDGGLEDIQESASVTEACEDEAPTPVLSRSNSSLAAPTMSKLCRTYSSMPKRGDKKVVVLLAGVEEETCSQAEDTEARETQDVLSVETNHSVGNPATFHRSLSDSDQVSSPVDPPLLLSRTKSCEFTEPSKLQTLRRPTSRVSAATIQSSQTKYSDARCSNCSRPFTVGTAQRFCTFCGTPNKKQSSVRRKKLSNIEPEQEPGMIVRGGD